MPAAQQWVLIEVSFEIRKPNAESYAKVEGQTGGQNKLRSGANNLENMKEQNLKNEESKYSINHMEQLNSRNV